MTPRVHRWVWAVVCGAAFVVVGAPAGADTHSQSNPDGYVVAVSPSHVAPGQTLQISGFGFPSGIDVSGQICGDDDMAGSADCVLDNTGIAGTNSQGHFSMSVVVAIPPVPCPCVAVVSSTQLSTTPSSPVTVIGAPVGPLKSTPSAATVRQPLQILNAQLSGNGPWTSWFGGFAHRTLAVTVHNPNGGTYPNPTLVLGAGKAGSSLSTVSTSPLPSLRPGETTTVYVNVVFPPFTFGTNEVVGVVGDAALKERIKVTTTIVPWGLFVVGLFILQLILLLIRNALRRRNGGRDAGSSPPPAEAMRSLTPPHGTPAQPATDEVPEEVAAI